MTVRVMIMRAVRVMWVMWMVWVVRMVGMWVVRVMRVMGMRVVVVFWLRVARAVARAVASHAEKVATPVAPAFAHAPVVAMVPDCVVTRSLLAVLIITQVCGLAFRFIAIDAAASHIVSTGVADVHVCETTEALVPFLNCCLESL